MYAHTMGQRSHLLRVPEELMDSIEARMRLVDEHSRNAWITRALRWALDQPVRREPAESSTKT